VNKTFWLGFVAVFAVAQVLGFLIHQIMLDQTYQSLASVFRPEAEMMDKMWIMIVSSGISLLIFCYVFTKGYENRGIGEGIRFGVLIGLFLSLPYVLDQYVVYPITASLAMIWLVTGVVTFTILGAVFSAIYKPAE